VLVYFQKLKEEYKPALNALQQQGNIQDTKNSEHTESV
jgi:hypothetical protein